jgi:hypothetical protein
LDIEIEHLHAHPVGHGVRVRGHWKDFAIPLCALLVSFVSIFIAWHHGQEMKELVRQNARLVQANSFPHVQLFAGEENSNGNGDFQLAMSNQGNGPALIRTAEVRVDGRPVPNVQGLVAACCEATSSDFGFSSVAGRMLRPGEIAPYLIVSNSPTSAKLKALLKKALADRRLETRVCFCSVFDECWFASSKPHDMPEPVAQCPTPELMYRT